MAKEKVVLSPEELAKKKEKRAKGWARCWAILLAIVLVISAPALGSTLSMKASESLTYEASENTDNSGAVSGNVSTNTGSSDNTANVPSDSGSASTDTPAADNGATDTPAADNGATNNGGSSADKGNAGAPAGTLSASSSTAEIVNYFNTAINKVKPSAKQVELTKELNKEAGGIEGNLPGALTSIANSLISSNMGEKDLSSLDPGMVKATTVEQKNAMFPVENESWSSKLTADDVEKAEVQENGGKYVITLHIKADEPSESTAHGVGHCGKIFSVIMPSIVTDNAGPAASMIKDVKTGHKDGIVKITVDKATGNVTDAFYSYVWTLSLKALGVELSIPFGLEKTFVITW